MQNNLHYVRRARFRTRFEPEYCATLQRKIATHMQHVSAMIDALAHEDYMFPEGFRIDAKLHAEEMRECGMTLLAMAETLGVPMPVPEPKHRDLNLEALQSKPAPKQEGWVMRHLCGPFGKLRK